MVTAQGLRIRADAVVVATNVPAGTFVSGNFGGTGHQVFDAKQHYLTIALSDYFVETGPYAMDMKTKAWSTLQLQFNWHIIQALGPFWFAAGLPVSRKLVPMLNAS